MELDKIRQKVIDFNDSLTVPPTEGKNNYHLEDYVLRKLQHEAGKAEHCIIETTGDWWRIQQLYTPQLVHRGIYTIRFHVPIEECIERSEKRNRVMPAPYDADELQALHHYKPNIPANLIVDLAGKYDIAKVYEEIEWYILKAQAFYSAKEVRPLAEG